jgi:hypothetical protein
MSVTDARGICGIDLDRDSFDLMMNSCIIAERTRRPGRRSNESKGLPILKRLKHSFSQDSMDCKFLSLGRILR